MKLRTKVIFIFGFLILIIVGGIIVVNYITVSNSFYSMAKGELSNIINLSYDYINTTLDVSIKNYLRGITERNMDILKKYYKMYKDGEISEAEAKRRTREVMLSQRIGKTGYVVAVGVRKSKLFLDVHPALLGADCTKTQGCKAWYHKKSGWCEYIWRNPNDRKFRKKSAYLLNFKPWNWILGATTFRDELTYVLKIEDIEQNLKNIKINKSGYIYIIDNTGKVLVHPFLKGKNFYNQKDANGKYFIRQIIKRKKGLITYMWKNPNENIIREKYAYYSYLPELGWYIIVSGYTSEVREPAVRVGKISLTIGFGALPFLVIIILLFSKSITNPLNEIILGAKQISERKFDYRIKIDNVDELNILAGSFNDMAQELKIFTEDLETLVRDRTRELNDANDKLVADLEIAKKIQENIIKDLPEIPELPIEAEYVAMEQLGGDIYDVRRIGRDTYSFMIADVSGHGVPAALITAMAKTSFINHSHFSQTPSQTCEAVNRDLYSLIGDTDYYLTAFYAVIDVTSMVMHYTNCAHQPTYIYRAETNEIIELNSNGFFIGSFEEPNYVYKTVQLKENDKILLYTDGITEARNEKREFYTNERLIDLIKAHGNKNNEDLLKNLITDVEQFCNGHPADDDKAIMLVEVSSVRESDGSESKIVSSDRIESKIFNDEAEIKIKHFKEIFNSLDLDNSSLQEKIKIIRNLFKNKDYDNAESHINKLLPIFSDNLKILEILGVIYFNTKQYKEALEVFLKIKKIDANFKNIEQKINLLKTLINE